MEATAVHNFGGESPDELPFRRGDILKVLSKGTDAEPHWFKAEKDGQEGFIPDNYIEMKPHGWYAGRIKRAEAEQRLLQTYPNGTLCQPDGAFLVRDSESVPGELSLSVKVQDRVQHFRIMRDQGTYYIWADRYFSVNALIDHHRRHSISNGTSPQSGSTQVVLRDPVSITNPPLVGRPRAIALYDFKAEDTRELSFQKDQVLEILDSNDPNWWQAQLNGCTGLIPSNYVRFVTR